MLFATHLRRFLSYCLLAVPVQAHADAPPAPSLTAGTGTFLARYVNADGNVNYAAIKRNPVELKALLRRVETFDAAAAYDRGERCDMEAGMAKFYASEAAVSNSQDAMRVFGGYSYSKEYDIERLYRDSMLMCIGEGTNEMQRMIISKQWVKRNRV